MNQPDTSTHIQRSTACEHYPCITYVINYQFFTTYQGKNMYQGSQGKSEQNKKWLCIQTQQAEPMNEAASLAVLYSSHQSLANLTSPSDVFSLLCHSFAYTFVNLRTRQVNKQIWKHGVSDNLKKATCTYENTTNHRLGPPVTPTHHHSQPP